MNVIRLIKEHRELEDRRQIQDHLTHVLDEVKEGKRKFLRTAAFPELSSIPRAIPLDQSLSVSIAYEPGDLKFNIISQESKTGFLSPHPAARAQPLPFEALKYSSTITKIDHISALFKKHGLKMSSDIPVRAPHPDERSCYAPQGSNRLQYASWSQEHLKTGAHL